MTKKTTIKISLSCIVLIVLIFVGVWYWQYEKYYPNTDDAYVQAHIIQISAQVTGPVNRIGVENNQLVKKGQFLFSIDPAPFQLALNQAKAKLALAKQQMAADEAAVLTAKAVIEERLADEVEAQQNYNRIIVLVRDGRLSQSQGDKVISRLAQTRGALLAAQKQLQQTKAKLGATGLDNAQVKSAMVAVNQAKLNLSYTTITAPAAGVVSQFTLRVGNMVASGLNLFALVENNFWWVNANFKETDLARIKPGQGAAINVDIYPSYTFKGFVQSISRGSGAAFSILPPENATGNWVKVVQRFPVKVVITNLNPRYPLRVGASASVTVDTKNS